MKITHNKIGRNLNLTDTGKLEKAEQSQKGKSASALSANSLEENEMGGAKVNLSQQALDIKRAKEIAVSAPDVREDKVAELQRQIDAGTYKVSAKDLADKMVDEEMLWS